VGECLDSLPGGLAAAKKNTPQKICYPIPTTDAQPKRAHPDDHAEGLKHNRFQSLLLILIVV
jgi:hypothetical protein